VGTAAAGHDIASAAGRQEAWVAFAASLDWGLGPGEAALPVAGQDADNGWKIATAERDVHIAAGSGAEYGKTGVERR